jgi:L-amino acid N-acyltransferase YncA
MAASIRAMTQRDAVDVRRIHANGIATGLASFETEPPSWETFDAGHLDAGRFVAVMDGRVVGWAAMRAVSDRCVYAGVAEVSVYVAVEHVGQGVGRALLGALIVASEEAGIWTLESRIIAENLASVRLHERCGFRTVGIRERLGRRDGIWHDVVLMERRVAD